jgi:hypothetical protein
VPQAALLRGESPGASSPDAKSIKKAAEHAKEEAKARKMVGAQIEANVADGHFGKSLSAIRTMQISS